MFDNRDHKWAYLFSEGQADMKQLLGGKGANVAEMMHVGLPVPPGFTITTQACNAYNAYQRQFPEGMWTISEACAETITAKLASKQAAINRTKIMAPHPLLSPPWAFPICRLLD